MAEFVLLDEVEKEIEKNRYLIMRNISKWSVWVLVKKIS